MNKKLFAAIFVIACFSSKAQVGINTTSPKGAFDVFSLDSGIVVPRVANTAAVLTPTSGMIIFDLSTECFKGYQNNRWTECGLIAIDNGTSIPSAFNCNKASVGLLTAGVPVSNVSQTITVTVETAGTYNYSATANGVTFSASGTFQSTGEQDVILVASGTPVLAGASEFSLNTVPTCSFSRSVATGPEPLPSNITLGKTGPQLIGSVYDLNYLPFVMPSGPATFDTNQNADGSNEAIAVDVQGTITTTGVTVRIPYLVTSSSASLPAFSQMVEIPAALTEDGVSRTLQLSYPAATLNAGNGDIFATLKAVGGVLNVKKLDIQSGIGNDVTGVLLTQFQYPINAAGTKATFEVRVIAAIPDRNIADPEHVFFYMPVTSTNGNIWLNNNLGADYSNTKKPWFNPGQQAIAVDDFKAYGNAFQWGRYSDGHELVNWEQSTITPLHGSTDVLSSTSNPGHNLWITNNPGENAYSWTSVLISNLWKGKDGNNNPCPIGFKIPSTTEWYGLAPENITNSSTALSSVLKFTNSGYRVNGSTTAGSLGSYHSSTESYSDTFSDYIQIDPNYINSGAYNKVYGRSCRCLKE